MQTILTITFSLRHIEFQNKLKCEQAHCYFEFDAHLFLASFFLLLLLLLVPFVVYLHNLWCGFILGVL